MADSQRDAGETKRMEAAKRTESQEPKQKFVFNKCCFCVPLRTGCLILAYLYLVGTIVIGIFSIVGIVSLVNIMEHVPELHHSILIIVIALNAVTLVLALIALPFNILLLVGLHNKRRSFVKIYLIFQLTYLILSLSQNIVTISLGYANIMSIVIALAGLAFNIYYLLVMRSQYVKMGETNNTPGTYTYGSS